MTKSLQGKHILIPGGGGEIGQTIAEMACKGGATVTIWDKKSADRVSQDTCQYQTIDTTDEIKISTAFKELETTNNLPDILINCVGIFTHLKPFEALDLAEFTEHFQTNTTSCFLTCREALRKYKKRLTIINISSALSQKAIPLASAYSASKAAIDSLTRSIAVEYGAKGVLAVSLNPGPVAGTMLDNGVNEIAGLMGAPVEAVKQQLLDVIPSGQLTSSKEISRLALFIAAGQVPSLQGKQLNIDGGFTS